MDNTVAKDPVLADWNTIEPEPIPQPKGSEIFRNLYMRKVQEQAPKPTFDTTTPEYLKRAAKYNAIAKGLSQLANTVSLGIGGNVNKAEPDDKTPAYIQGHLQYLDRYRDMVDKYDLMNYNNQLKALGMSYDDAVRQENEAKNDQRYNDQIDYRDKKDAENEEWKRKEWEQRVKRDEAYLKSQEALVKQRLQPRSSGGGRSTTDKDQVEIKTKYGTVPISKADYSYYRGQAMNTPELLKDTRYFVPVLNSYNEPTGDYELRRGIDEDDLVRRMIEIEHEQQSKPQSKPQVNKNGMEAYYGKDYKKEMTGGKQAETQTKTIDYSKLTY